VSAIVRLTQMLAEAVGVNVTQSVSGATLAEILNDLFGRRPGLRGHIVTETGEIRPHVAIFVNGDRAGLDDPVPDNATVYVLHAVSGG
jgi:molybdopterin converting factor small subunit